MTPTRAAKTSVPAELDRWFKSLQGLCDLHLFSVSPSEGHRDAAILGTLTRNGRILVESKLDRAGNLYTPLCFVLAAAARRLRAEVTPRHWRAALEAVQVAGRQLGSGDAADGADLGVVFGTPAGVFKNLMDEALVNAGVTGHPTILDHENRQLALGLAVNWGLRFLIAYALEATDARRHRGARDLPWIRELVRPRRNSGRLAGAFFQPR